MHAEVGAQRAVAPSRMTQLLVGAIGVVFGDIGTSPLYTLRQCFTGLHRLDLSHTNILGVLSIIFWSLVIVVTLKYVVLIMRADNRGEGGILALTALVSRGLETRPRRRWLLVLFGIVGAAMFYGDGMITPAISVLGAVEGLEIVTSQLHLFVLPLALGIIVTLFVIQRTGTARVGAFFGPVMCVWFATLAVLGVGQIVAEPTVLARRQSGARDRIHRAESARGVSRARRRRAGGHRDRSAVRRHGPFRAPSDSPGVAVLRDAGAGVELLRTRRVVAGRSGRNQESVLSAGTHVGVGPADRAGDRARP